MKITINERQSFLISDESGDIIPGTEQGLYSLDTRFLSDYRIYVNGKKPLVLTGKPLGYFSSIHYLALAKEKDLPPETIVISRKRLISKGLHEDITIANYNHDKIAILKIELKIDNDFSDIFEVKSARRTGEAIKPKYETTDESLIISGSQKNFYREARINFSQPFSYKDKKIVFNVELQPKEMWQCFVDFLTLSAPSDRQKAAEVPVKRQTGLNVTAAKSPGKISNKAWLRETSSFETDNMLLRQAFEKSRIDLSALRLSNFAGEGDIPAAGIPWYTTAFGRDSIIASYQTLALWPNFARGTLKVLAKYQGQKVDSFNEEQPGRILHEMRYGRLASTRLVPHYRYYGTIDATPLFIVLAEQYYRWSGDKQLIRELKDNIYAALNWIDDYGDQDGDGFVEYKRSSKRGIYNQGWKDSKDAVSFADGELAKAPIALVEVQGYVYAAKTRGAALLRLLGDKEGAASLEKQAVKLKEAFNQAFWMPEKGYYAMGLDKDKKQIDTITSNGVHVLWTRIADVDKAEIVAKRALEEDMFSGWGIRTLSKNENKYNPVSYHNGSIWPHDNSMIMVGLLKYGLEKEAAMVFEGLVKASRYFADRRLPELFCGFSKEESALPIAYPTSSSPQAWAAGAIPYMAFALLRARPDIDKKEITIAPFLLPSMNWAFYSNMKTAGEEFSVRIDRADSTFLPTIANKPDWLKIIEIGR